ncbi:DUF4401 domain-containing protein [Mucilaginibacter psychrotolerans]|uniref:DUF4401 domain-containing protein n=1 Tax=Mucilaginibacter psychrotolerans TaxID=1524096 RepID=A0A4Y8SI33_9SPHI|nr:DUF4401 domain-containing protein [Mucilaginibacter psychrotolerans]TFF38197.1 DUF4401 domain-containing protein [Mucilaginibacter psychrotolerans]
MQTNNHTDGLIERLSELHGEELAINREAIDKELAADAEAYQGLGIKLLSIGGGLLATFFFLGFVGLVLTQASEASIFVGLLIMAGAIWLNKTSTNTILDTVLISSYLASFGMIAFGMVQLHVDANAIATVLLILAVITCVVTSGYMHNFFSVLVASGCLFAFVLINDAYEITHLLTLLLAWSYAWMCLNETDLIAQNPQLNARYMALRNGLLFSFIAILAYLGVADFRSSSLQDNFISGLIIIAVTAFVLYAIVRALALRAKDKLMVYVLGGILLASTVFAPAICGALLIVFLSFHTGHRTGIAAGLVALVYFTGQYYYDLSYTLLIKSEIMMASGALFFLAWFILKKQLKRYEQN